MTWRDRHRAFRLVHDPAFVAAPTHHPITGKCEQARRASRIAADYRLLGNRRGTTQRVAKITRSGIRSLAAPTPDGRVRWSGGPNARRGPEPRPLGDEGRPAANPETRVSESHGARGGRSSSSGLERAPGRRRGESDGRPDLARCDQAAERAERRPPAEPAKTARQRRPILTERMSCLPASRRAADPRRPRTVEPMGVANLNKSLAVVDSQRSDGSPATARRVWFPLVDPMTPISAEATEVHGIRDEDVADRPAVRERGRQDGGMLQDCDIGGHYVLGDLQLIELEMGRAGVECSGGGRSFEPRRLGGCATTRGTSGASPTRRCARCRRDGEARPTRAHRCLASSGMRCVVRIGSTPLAAPLASRLGRWPGVSRFSGGVPRPFTCAVSRTWSFALSWPISTDRSERTPAARR